MDTIPKTILLPVEKTAAQMIAEVAQACSINPQVLLVLLQKEQGLITDDWPWPSQYTKATGFACPDTASCNPAYAGLFNQLYYGARQYQLYKANPTGYGYRAGRTQNILYSPAGGCGGSDVYIQNQATAGLYNYTPYQPNAAALANLNGTGDGCSAYGNRNFWRMFNNWFGSSTADCSNDSSSQSIIRLYDPKTFNHFYSTNYCEMNSLVKSYGFIYEGNAFTQVTGSTPNSVPVYRLYNPRTSRHFYTTLQADVDQATRYAGFTLEGTAFYMLNGSAPGAIPVYRLYNPRTNLHMWTTSQADINQATQQAGYTLEGPTFYTP